MCNNGNEVTSNYGPAVGPVLIGGWPRDKKQQGQIRAKQGDEQYFGYEKHSLNQLLHNHISSRLIRF